jgi:internalin A
MAMQRCHLRDGFPSEWFEVKDKLPRTRKSFISFDEYRKNCHKWKVKSGAEQILLGRYLHDLGVMLNFREDERLQDTHVLKPHWVTEGIYTIINARQLAEQRGELRVRDLKGILPDKVYPAHMHPFILDLMKKFGLCFTFPDEDTRFLIPELLDIQEPEAVAEFKPEMCLNLRYDFEVLPEGLLPRFIVRTHGLIEDEYLWRTGVILRFEEARALVKADMADKKVFIRVTGRAEARRRLLAIIRSDFERCAYGSVPLTVASVIQSEWPSLPLAVLTQRVLPFMQSRFDLVVLLKWAFPASRSDGLTLAVGFNPR